MPENDIYDNKTKYENLKERIRFLTLKPEDRKYPHDMRPISLRKEKYIVKNPENLIYFKKLFQVFDARDISYIRRLRLLRQMKTICHATEKNLKECGRDDIDKIVAFAHTVNHSPKSKYDFITDIKHLWKTLLPETDQKGRVDDTIMPYSVRHLRAKQDKSKEKLRNDKFTIDEFEKLVESFSQDQRMQAYITLAFESLGRPQEILYTRVKDVEIFDNYAKIWISEHGKEGTGFLQSIDSFPYVAKWYNSHPLKHNSNAFFFINTGDRGKYEQLKPFGINKHIREKLKLLKISKKITCYSFKRNGVTFRRLRGDSDAVIQHTARWTSTKQLKTYDYSQQDETFMIELAKRGIIKDKKYKDYRIMTKKCLFCDTINGITDDVCSICKRPLDRERILKEHESKEKELLEIKKQLEVWKDNIKKELMEEAVQTLKREITHK